MSSGLYNVFKNQGVRENVRNRNKRIIGCGILGMAMASVIWMFLWGKLFPFSPLHLGFAKCESAHSIIYIQKGANIGDCDKVDFWLPAVEEFHELKFIRKPICFVFRDRESYLRRTITRARFYAYPNGTLVISPWAVEEAQAGKLSMEIYIKHELSHTILYQHMGWWAMYRYPQWLMEGVAVYSTSQMGTGFYPSCEETRQLIKQGNFLPPKYFKTGKEKSVPIRAKNPIAFIYSEFACIVDYLIATEGKSKFITYMKRLLEGGDQDDIFREVYGKSIEDSLRQFKKQIFGPDLQH